MSRERGKSAGMAAVTCAGVGIATRFQTREQQRERLAELVAQQRYYERKGDAEGLAEVRVLIHEIRSLSSVTVATPRRREGL